MLGQFEQAIRTESPDAGINDIALAVRHRRDDFQNRQRGHHVSGYGSDGGALSMKKSGMQEGNSGMFGDEARAPEQSSKC